MTKEMPLTKRIGALWVLAVLFGCAPAPDPGRDWFHTGTGPLVLSGVTVVDVRTGQTRADADVFLDKGTIVKITDGEGPAPASSATVIDARGKYVIPGYVDMHVHIVDRPYLTESLALMLAGGVTGFRQMSGSQSVLEDRRAGALPLPEGAPRLLAMPSAVLTPLNARNPKAAIKRVQSQAAAGADFIKVGLVGRPAFLAVMAEAERLNIPVAGHIPPGVCADAPSVLGMRSVEHLGAMNALAIACSSKADELQAHATPAWMDKLSSLPFEIPFADRIVFFLLNDTLVNPIVGTPPEGVEQLRVTVDTFDLTLCQELAADFVASGTWQVPTLINTKSHYLADSPEFLNAPWLKFMPQADRERWRRVTTRYTTEFDDTAKHILAQTYARELQLVGMLDRAGIPMLTGSDGGPGTMGSKLHMEFGELADAGLSTLKILQMATLNPAIFFHEEGKWGTVAPGMRADLVVLDRNPLESVDHMHAINAVIVGGNYYGAKDLARLKQRVADARAVDAAP